MNLVKTGNNIDKLIAFTPSLDPSWRKSQRIFTPEVEVETLDETLDAEEIFGTVEAVKTVSDLLMPLTGEVIEFNETLEDEPEKVNSDPYGDGWMIKISISDASQIDELLSAEDYTALIGA